MNCNCKNYEVLLEAAREVMRRQGQNDASEAEQLITRINLALPTPDEKPPRLFRAAYVGRQQK